MRIVPFTVSLTIGGVCCVVAAYFCHFYYSRYQSTVTLVERNLSSFSARLSDLEKHKSRELTPIRIWGVISTADRPPDEYVKSYQSSEKRSDNFFKASNAKGGPVILPEIRLPSAMTTNSEFDIQIDSQFGIVADVWLSFAAPYTDLAAFEEFHVDCPNKTNSVRLIARPKPGASVQMRFDVLVLCEK